MQRVHRLRLLAAMTIMMSALPAIGGELKAPVRLEAEGKPIDTPPPGHSAPFVGDFDGDGKPDLLVGQFADGKLRIYKNVGTASKPSYAAGFEFMVGKEPGTVPTGRCVGFGPQLVDFDGDGIQDIISGSWPGEMYFFRGKGQGEFVKGEKILGKDGFPLNIGGGVKETDDEIMITGDAKFEKDGDTNIVVYNGKKYKEIVGKQVMVTGCASVVFATDWNGDGKLDLVVGDIRGRVGVYFNTGTTKKWEFDKPEILKAGGKEIRVEHGDSGPAVADWDGDGLNDLIVGAGDGSVMFYRNIGTAKEPKLAKGVTLVSKTSVEYGKASTKPMPGMRVKICIVDWNGDGKLDLLMGDYTTQKPAPKQYTDDEKKKIDAAKKRNAELEKEYSLLIDKVFGPKRSKDAKELKQVSEDLKKVQTEMSDLYKIIPPEEETHGWIWYFERTDSGDSRTSCAERAPMPRQLAK